MRGPDLKPRKKREGDKIKHGHARKGAMSPEYRIWAGMIKRCTNPREKCYPRYGGAGITVWKPWRESFAAFFGSVGPRPSPQHTIDRIDGRRGYEPGNVRWATTAEQNKNRKNVRLIDFNGQKLTAKEYCRAIGLSYHTYSYRRSILGWSFEDALRLGDGRKQSAPQ